MDINLLSELCRRKPEVRVVRWMSDRPASTLYLSVLTLGELRKGIEAVSEGPRKRCLLDWLDVELPTYFAGRILPIDLAVADRWRRLLAHAGRPLPAIDSLLAATALARGLTLVTRHLKHFQHPDLSVLDPWTA